MKVTFLDVFTKIIDIGLTASEAIGLSAAM